MKPWNNVTKSVKRGSLWFVFILPISISTTLFGASSYVDTYRIQTFDDVFWNNSWVYINLETQILCCSRWHFFPRPSKFTVVLNCLIFFIADCIVDIGIANRFEIVVSLFPDFWKLLIFVFRIVLLTSEQQWWHSVPFDVLDWNYYKYSTR